MTPGEIERRYYELKGRQASGQLAASQFAAAVRDLLAHDRAGRAWAIDPETAGWLVHDGQRWVPDPGGPDLDPGRDGTRRNRPGRPIGRIAVVLATLLVLLLAVDLSGENLSGWMWGRLPGGAAGRGAAAQPTPPPWTGAAGGGTSATAVPPAAPAPDGAFPSPEDVELAGEQVNRLLSVYVGAATPEEARTATRPFFAEGTDQHPAFVSQFFDVPASRQLRPAGGFRVVQKAGAGPGQAAVVAEATYVGASATESKLGWAFVLNRSTDGWRVASVQLNTAI
jgi:hypothetical protein